MRIAAVMGFGRERLERAAFKTRELEAQKQEASDFQEEIQREAEALLNRLRSQTRLRREGGEGGRPHPRSSH